MFIVLFLDVVIFKTMPIGKHHDMNKANCSKYRKISIYHLFPKRSWNTANDAMTPTSLHFLKVSIQHAK